MKLIQALGLDWRIFIAQFLNFAILIYILNRFAYKPIFDILEKRRLKVIQGLKDGEQAALDAESAQQNKKEIIAQSKKEANLIIDEARKQAELKYQEILANSKNDLALLMAEEKAKIAMERDKMFLELKKDMSSLLGSALEKVLVEKVDSKKDQEIISRAVNSL